MRLQQFWIVIPGAALAPRATGEGGQESTLRDAASHAGGDGGRGSSSPMALDGARTNMSSEQLQVSKAPPNYSSAFQAQIDVSIPPDQRGWDGVGSQASFDGARTSVEGRRLRVRRELCLANRESS